MKKNVNESGITLIALVVTIVVLLILAAITITYVLADDGIFGKAQSAAKAQEMAIVRDYISNAQAQLLIEHYDPTTTTSTTAASIMASNFPDGYSGTLLTDVEDEVLNSDGTTTGSDGKIDEVSGLTITVPNTNNTYNVEFSDEGVAIVTDPTATTSSTT